MRLGRSDNLHWSHFHDLFKKTKWLDHLFQFCDSMNYFFDFTEMPRRTQKTSFPENDSGCSHRGVGWLVWGCGQTMETSGSGRFGATATRILPLLSPLRLCSWPTYAKSLAPLSFLKAFLTRAFPWGADSSFCGELAHAFLKGRKEGGPGGLGWISEWAGVAKEMSLLMDD